MITIANALNSLRPNAIWSVIDTTIIWLDEKQSKPTDEEIQAEIRRLQELEKNSVYSVNRKIAYQLESDPIFFKWQAGEATELEWKAKRDEIKSRYPDQ